ncbi:MAG: hypothetical protein H8E05_01420, partial [Bacteroidetes bacterium]|nr:hypothetical protein [Bacteroidota bacterium]
MPEKEKTHTDKEYADLGKEEAVIKFSSRLVGLLSSMMRVYNKENPENKISLSQLKSVYCNAAKNYAYAGYSRGEWSLARVNLFLRVARGEKPNAISDYERASLGGLTFEAKVLATV